MGLHYCTFFLVAWSRRVNCRSEECRIRTLVPIRRAFSSPHMMRFSIVRTLTESVSAASDLEYRSLGRGELTSAITYAASDRAAVSLFICFKHTFLNFVQLFQLPKTCKRPVQWLSPGRRWS